MQIYQVKMRTYKRVPIPETLYKLMQVYLEKNGIGPDDYAFPNKDGEAFRYGTFCWQMKKHCRENNIAGVEYLFKPVLKEKRKGTGMENRIYYKDLECYGYAAPKQLQALNKIPYYDLEQLPSDKIRAAFAAYIKHRGKTVAITTIKSERHFFNSLCRFLEK